MMRKAGNTVFLGVLVCLLLAGALFFCGEARAEDCSAAFDRAAKKYYQHKQDSTLDAATCRALTVEFQSVSDNHPDCDKGDQALYLAGLLGKMAYKQGKDPKDLVAAEVALTDLTTRHPQSKLIAKADYHLGEIHVLTGEKSEAAKWFGKCVDSKDGEMADKAREQLAKLPPAPDPPPVATDPIRVDDTAVNLPAPSAPVEKNDLAEEDLGAPSDAGSNAPAENEETDSRMTIEEIIRGDVPADAPHETAAAPEGPAFTPDPPPVPANEPAPAAVPPAARGNYAQLTAIRYWTNKDYTRVVVEVSREVPFTEPVLLPPDRAQGVPPRLYLDLTGTVISKEIADPDTPEAGCFTLPIGDGLLKKARAGQYQPDVARVVLDIERIDRFKAFPLPGETFRFVIDVYGSPAPPAVARVRDRLKPRSDNRASGREDGDALSRWFKTDRPRVKSSGRKYVVVVDAGHGGKDPGARGPSGTREKDIALAIAREVKRKIERERGEVEVILTRSDDRFIPLVERTAIANTANADLFVSVHINAAKNREATGVETYFLDNTTDRAALKLAAKENFVAEDQLLDSADSTNRILADMIQSSKVEDSVPLAHSIQDKLVRSLSSDWNGVVDKGVKKAPFWVLTGATMPCVLVEVGFISNRMEEKRLMSPEYQKAAAAGIAAGIDSYLDSYLQVSRNE